MGEHSISSTWLEYPQGGGEVYRCERKVVPEVSKPSTVLKQLFHALTAEGGGELGEHSSSSTWLEGQGERKESRCGRRISPRSSRHSAGPEQWYHTYGYTLASGGQGEMGEHSTSATWLDGQAGGEEPGLWLYQESHSIFVLVWFMFHIQVCHLCSQKIKIDVVKKNLLGISVSYHLCTHQCICFFNFLD